jgi:hypothetical protein
LICVVSCFILLIPFIIIACKYIYKQKSKCIIENNITINSDQSLLINSEITSDYQTIRSSVHIKLDFSKFNKEERIGKGSFGNVFKCSIPPNLQHKYAVKQIETVYAEEVKQKYKVDVFNG